MERFNIGASVIKLNQVDSTNTYAMQLVQQGKIKEGTVILADFQTDGRGQSGNSWESEPNKNLTFSVILFPGFLEAARQFYIAMSISNGLLYFLKNYLKRPRIKWPNDMVIGEKKIAGMLIENVIARDNIQSSVIGIGLNVNQRIFNRELVNPTSMALETGTEFDLEVLFPELLEWLDIWVAKLYEKDFVRIKTMYLNNLIHFNEWTTYTDRSGKFEGRVVDVAESGEILVRKRNGESRSYTFREIH